LYNQKNNVPPHTKVCGLIGTCFLDEGNSFEFPALKIKVIFSDPKLKPVSYDPILKNGVLIYGQNKTFSTNPKPL